MNTPRLVVLGLAAVAAGGAAFLARGLLGGGTPQVQAARMPEQVSTSEVLVAASDLTPGQQLEPDEVRWQKWPSSSVDPSFVTSANTTNIEAMVKGTVVRSPIVAGEPITNAKIVHSDATGFMAATLTPGMRAVSIPVSVASLAGGFIMPNDRVDLMLTSQISDSPRRFRATTFLRNVRVLAIDQAFSDDKNKSQKPVSDVKTATLELSPEQAERVARAQASGTLSLSLRPLADKQALAGNNRVAAARAKYMNSESSDSGEVSVIRYGVLHPDAASSGE